ncbi:MAG: hypothetical protein AABX98_02800 [Nanoarchaeota archaeon]
MTESDKITTKQAIKGVGQVMMIAIPLTYGVMTAFSTCVWHDVGNATRTLSPLEEVAALCVVANEEYKVQVKPEDQNCGEIYSGLLQERRRCISNKEQSFVGSCFQYSKHNYTKLDEKFVDECENEIVTGMALDEKLQANKDKIKPGKVRYEIEHMMFLPRFLAY